MSESTAKPTTSQPQRKSPRLLAQSEHPAAVAKRLSKSPTVELHETAGAPARMKLKTKRQSKTALPISSESETATEECHGTLPECGTPKANVSESASASKPKSHESSDRRKTPRTSLQSARAGSAAKPETLSKSTRTKIGTADAHTAPNKSVGSRRSQKVTEFKSDTEAESQPDAPATTGRKRPGRLTLKQTREAGTSMESEPETDNEEPTSKPKRESLRAKASYGERPHAEDTPEKQDINQFRCISNFFEILIYKSPRETCTRMLLPLAGSRHQSQMTNLLVMIMTRHSPRAPLLLIRLH